MIRVIASESQPADGPGRSKYLPRQAMTLGSWEPSSDGSDPCRHKSMPRSAGSDPMESDNRLQPDASTLRRPLQKLHIDGNIRMRIAPERRLKHRSNQTVDPTDQCLARNRHISRCDCDPVRELSFTGSCGVSGCKTTLSPYGTDSPSLPPKGVRE